jgi:hypothetical protein
MMNPDDKTNVLYDISDWQHPKEEAAEVKKSSNHELLCIF